MIILERKMQSKKIIPPISNYALDCQASFNSDGAITLRNYSRDNREEDEIVILSAEETKAIIELVTKLGAMIQNRQLPF